ncbi:MAG: hypothetical protein ACRC7O_15380 [Fimbriiglobus sp.]
MIDPTCRACMICGRECDACRMQRYAADSTKWTMIAAVACAVAFTLVCCLQAYLSVKH